MKKQVSTPSLAVAGMLAAVVMLATVLFKLPLPMATGYVHLGDTLILFSAMLIGPAAAAIGGVGSALADLLGNYAVYALPTLCIKALVGFLASRRLSLNGQHALLRCALTFTVAELAMVLSYALFESFTYGFAAAISAVPANFLQGAFSVALACVLLPVARRIQPMLKNGGRPL